VREVKTFPDFYGERASARRFMGLALQATVPQGWFRWNYVIMTKHSWILVVFAVALCILQVRSFIEFRALRTKLRRRSLSLFVSCAVSWAMFSFIISDNMVRFIYLAALLGIYAPYIFWILRQPRDEASGPAAVDDQR
jgi:hypothetical protein